MQRNDCFIQEEKSEKLIKVDYESYEDLKNFDKDTDFNSLINKIIQNLKDSPEWVKAFYSINDLRRLLKFNNEIFLQILDSVVNQLNKLSLSIRSNLSKLTLILIKEIFQAKFLSTVYNQKILINSVILGSSSTKAFIKEESLNALDALAENEKFYNLNTISIILDEVSSKNLKISENSFNYIDIIFSNWKTSEILKISSMHNWGIILQKIVNLNLLKREPYFKRSYNLMYIIFNKIGQDEFSYFFSECEIFNKNKKLIIEMINMASKKK
jgi:hypothetical protein